MWFTSRETLGGGLYRRKDVMAIRGKRPKTRQLIKCMHTKYARCVQLCREPDMLDGALLDQTKLETKLETIVICTL